MPAGLLQNELLNSIADSSNNWMVTIWKDHHLLLFSDTYMVKIENDVVIPSKPVFIDL